MRHWTDDDTWHFLEGTHDRLYEVLGAFPIEEADGTATLFRVWAPHVEQVCVVGDANDWETGATPMTALEGTGVWEVRARRFEAGHRYKFRILGRDGTWHEKADPFARHGEVPPLTASRIAGDAHRWQDHDWMARRADGHPWREPMAVYEVHALSWMAFDEDDERPAFRQLAEPLADHVLEMGFTHVEFLPIMEHPYVPSWGYQVLGHFAPTARMGTPADFAWLVDHLHRRGVGVLLDWVPAHFPTDAHGLYRFTGEAVYEHPDPRRGYHPDWTTAIFDYDKPEVRSFLLSSACSWLDRFHADGLRVDAVASMLYLDYSREGDQWIPNEHGGRENLGAIQLFRDLNRLVGERFPGALTIAEDSTAWPKVTHPVDEGGLGFGFKWDMGWMNDTLAYFEQDPVHRKHHHGKLTFRGMYQHSESFVLPLSHDEVVHGKGSLLNKMPGDDWQKFANLRLLLATMTCQPGKKLLFMGSELAPFAEWTEAKPLPWAALDDPRHRGVRDLLAALLGLYRSTPALWRGDDEPEGFAWVEVDDADQSLLAWRRIDPEGAPDLAIVANHTPVPRPGWRMGLPKGRWEVVLSTDEERFGGSGAGTIARSLATRATPAHGQDHSLVLDVPPLGALLLKAT